MATTLNVSPQEVELTVGKTQIISVETNAPDGYTYTIDKSNVIKYDKDTKTITAEGEGNAVLNIRAKNGTDSAVNALVNVKVTQLTVDLEVRPNITNLEIGEKQTLLVSSNADSYTIESEDPDIVSVNNSNSVITGVSGGTTKVTITGVKKYYKPKSVTLNITVTAEAGVPVKFMLYNKHTGRTTTIRTNNNDSSKDEVFTLPTYSGTLITEEDLSDNIRVIYKPEIIYPNNGDSGVDGDMQATAFSTILGFNGTHTRTDWEIALDENFHNIILSKKKYAHLNHVMTSTSPSIPLTKVYVRMRYWSDSHVSDWSNTVSFTTNLCGPAGPQSVISGDCINGAYFGEISYKECISDDEPRRYIGNWETLKTIAADYTNIALTNGVGDDLVNALAGSQVHYKDKLYYAARYLRSSDNTFTVTPGTNNNYWREDTRETLDTPKQFLYNVGLGYNARPNKLNGHLKMSNATYWERDPYSAGSDKPTACTNYIYPWGMSGTTNTTLPNEYDVPKCSWLKFGYKGKILYTPKIPLLASIAWNDIAKVHAVYDKTKTMRIGTRLYYVRLMKEEEYKTLLIGLTDGTLGTINSNQLDIDPNTANASKNIFRAGLKQWIEDTREGTSRKVIYGGKTNVKTEDISPRLPNGVYRPVLELIPEGDEPYNNLPECPSAYDENFKYDKYTDTGYFGRITSSDFIAGDTLATSIGFTNGTAYLPNNDWFKFYWHGRIVFIPTSPMRYSVTWAQMRTNGLLYGVDLGGNGKTTISIAGSTFSVQQLNTVRGTPTWNDNTWRDRYGHSLTADHNHNGRVNWGSMVMCLLNRVVGEKYSGRNFVYATDEFAKATTPDTGIGSRYACYQVGDSWAEFTKKYAIATHNNGSGSVIRSSYLYCQYNAKRDTATWVNDLNNPEYCPYMWYSGLLYIYTESSVNSGDGAWGWRPALFLEATE